MSQTQPGAQAPPMRRREERPGTGHYGGAAAVEFVVAGLHALGLDRPASGEGAAPDTASAVGLTPGRERRAATP